MGSAGSGYEELSGAMRHLVLSKDWWIVTSSAWKLTKEVNKADLGIGLRMKGMSQVNCLLSLRIS